MENTSSAILHFKDSKYRLSAILGLVKQAPPIEVKPEDINPITVFTPENAIYKVSITPDVPEMKVGEIVFYKQEGKFTVLLGQQSAIRAIQDAKGLIKGRLISGPGLKKTRIEEAPPPVDIHAPVYEPEPSRAAAKPSYNNERATRSYHSDSRRTPSSNVTVTRKGFGKSRSGIGQ
jgi:hypothetical protein